MIMKDFHNNSKFISIDDTNLIANLSTTIQTSQAPNNISTTLLMDQSTLPFLEKTRLNLEKTTDFHKKLQGKLEKSMKKKDYQLLLELTK